MPTSLSSAALARRQVATALWVCALALWPLPGWRWHVVSFGVALGWSLWARFPLRQLGRRALLLWVFAGLIAIGWLDEPDWRLRTGNLLLKSTLSLWALSLLVYSAPVPDQLAALRCLRVPRPWTEILGFWGRYHAVLGQEWHRLELARRARTLHTDRRREFTTLANTLGLLFIRAYERAEQVHRAMLARGYRELP